MEQSAVGITALAPITTHIPPNSGAQHPHAPALNGGGPAPVAASLNYLPLDAAAAEAAAAIATGPLGVSSLQQQQQQQQGERVGAGGVIPTPGDGLSNGGVGEGVFGLVHPDEVAAIVARCWGGQLLGRTSGGGGGGGRGGGVGGGSISQRHHTRGGPQRESQGGYDESQQDSQGLGAAAGVAGTQESQQGQGQGQWHGEGGLGGEGEDDKSLEGVIGLCVKVLLEMQESTREGLPLPVSQV